MGLFDGYFDPQQFAAAGGLLGRLLSLQQLQPKHRQGASLEDAPPISSQALQPMPWLNVSGTGASLGARRAVPNPALQQSYAVCGPQRPRADHCDCASRHGKKAECACQS